MEPSPPPAAPPEATLVENLLMGLGILLGLIGSIMINVGNNMQALGMGMAAEQKETRVDGCGKEGGKVGKRPKILWTAGTATFIFGSVINFVAFVFAAASVLAPLEAIQFVSNLVFARFITKVPVSRKMVAGSVLIVCGTIGAVAGGPLSVTSFTIAQLRGFWKSPAWITYVAAVWVTSLSMQAFWEVQTRRIKSGGRACGPPQLLPIMYAASSALIGTQSVVQAKAFSELMELWLGSGILIWVEWYTYAVLAYFLATVAFWLYRLNAALGKYDALFIIPLLQASYIVLATVAGGLYFQEFASMAWWQGCVFAFCIGIMFVGLAMLMPPITGHATPEPPESNGEQGADADADAEELVKLSFVRLSRSVSFANTSSFRSSIAARETEGGPNNEHRTSQVAAMYGGAGAGLSFTSSRLSFAGPLPERSFRTSSRARRANPSPAKMSLATENSLITIQMPPLGEVSEKDFSVRPSQESAQSNRSQKDLFRQIASGSPRPHPPPPESNPAVSATPSI